MAYTYGEQTDMLLVLGYCQGNCLAFVRVYGERFPNRPLPNHQTFANIERRLREEGSLKPRTGDRGRRPTIMTAEREEQILDEVARDSRGSTRRLGLQFGVSKNRLLRQ